MGKSKREKQQAYFFDNKALLALILPYSRDVDRKVVYFGL